VCIYGLLQNTKHTATAPNKEQTFNAMPNHTLAKLFLFSLTTHHESAHMQLKNTHQQHSGTSTEN
jgi:hypothetical protein